MAGRSRSASEDLSELPAIRLLEIDDIPQLRLGWSSRFDSDDVERILRASPGSALWVPATGEYVLGGPWRHRTEILAVIELSATANAVRLVQELSSLAASHGHRLIIASEHHETRRRAFYDASGFQLLEEIMIYELTGMRPKAPDLHGFHFDLVSIDDQEAHAALLELDHAAFPWLWWNSVEEFANYRHSPGVEIYLGRDSAERPISYVGVTRFRSWGHLDRIAVAPNLQGRGIGKVSLDWAVYVLAQGGARRVGLSTQARNSVSRQLYENYGFRRVISQDYLLYGRWLASNGSA